MSQQFSETTSGSRGTAPRGRAVYTVSALNEAAREVLETGLGQVWVEGEISNIARPASGHVYFSLKDERAQLRCAMFRSRNRGLGFVPDNGLRVVAYGRVSLYPARGDYQLIVDRLEAAGDGLLQLRFEQLKQKLFAEGLFDESVKRDLPAWPQRIGIITSPTGAALRDMLNVLGRRAAGIEIVIYPTAVQGEAAVPQILHALERANAREDCDVLIIGRGGGSLEDLWCFNDERVARAVYDSALPIVSGVGHEIDITITDLVADLRAPTPSAAAELVSPDAGDATRHLATLRRRLDTAVRYQFTARQGELRTLRSRLVSPRRQLELHQQRVDELAQRLAGANAVMTRLRHSALGAVQSRLLAHSPANLVKLLRRDIEHREQRLRQAINERLRVETAKLKRCEDVLHAVGPQATLERGYAIVTDADGGVVRDAEALNAGQRVTTRLASGRFTSDVVDKTE